MTEDTELRRQQIEIAERLQIKWLKRMEFLLDQGEIGPTEMATLARVLMSNGWNLDPALLPQKLADKLTTKLDPDELDDADVDVVDIRSRQVGT